MAATVVGEGCSQLLGPGRLLQKIHMQFQFESQAPDRSDKRWNSMAVDGNRGASISTAQEEFSDSTGIEDARF